MLPHIAMFFLERKSGGGDCNQLLIGKLGYFIIPPLFTGESPFYVQSVARRYSFRV